MCGKSYEGTVPRVVVYMQVKGVHRKEFHVAAWNAEEPRRRKDEWAGSWRRGGGGGRLSAGLSRRRDAFVDLI